MRNEKEAKCKECAISFNPLLGHNDNFCTRECFFTSKKKKQEERKPRMKVYVGEEICSSCAFEDKTGNSMYHKRIDVEVHHCKIKKHFHYLCRMHNDYDRKYVCESCSSETNDMPKKCLSCGEVDLVNGFICEYCYINECEL